MSKSVSGRGEKSHRQRWQGEAASLYAPGGGRKYLNQDERRRVLDAMAKLAPDQALFAQTLAWSGGRVSEVLALSASSFQIERGIVSLRTLKRRKPSVREVPIPPELTVALEAHFGLSKRQGNPAMANAPLWPWHRVTAWRVVRGVMTGSGIKGRHACARGLRHGFGIGTLQSGVPLNLTQRWLGHARISTTAIYAEACGPEELAFAAQFWRSDDSSGTTSRRSHAQEAHAAATL